MKTLNLFYFQIPIRHNQWVQFLRTKKPEHKHDTGCDSIDYGDFIMYNGTVNNQRDFDIMAAIGLKFNSYKETLVWNEFFNKKGAELNWDFSFPVEEPVIIPLYKVRGVKNIIERTRHMSLAEIEDSLDGWQFYIAKTVWVWSAIRISSDTQEKYHEKHGWDKTVARVNKFRVKMGWEKLKNS